MGAATGAATTNEIASGIQHHSPRSRSRPRPGACPECCAPAQTQDTRAAAAAARASAFARTCRCSRLRDAAGRARSACVAHYACARPPARALAPYITTAHTPATEGPLRSDACAPADGRPHSVPHDQAGRPGGTAAACGSRLAATGHHAAARPQLRVPVALRRRERGGEDRRARTAVGLCLCR